MEFILSNLNRRSSTFESIYRSIRILNCVSNRVLFRVYLNLILMIFSSLLESLSVLSISSFVNQIQSSGNIDESKLINIGFLSNYLSDFNPTKIFILFIFLTGIIRIFTLWFNCKTSAIIGNEITIKAYSTILNWPYKKHRSINSSDNTAALTQFSKAIVGTITNFLIIIHSFLIAITICLTLLNVDLKLSLSLILIISCAYFINNILMDSFIKKTSNIVKRETLNTFKIIKESLEGIKDIILNDTFNKEIRNLVKKDFKLKNATVDNKFVAMYPKYLFESIIIIALILFLRSENDYQNNVEIISQISVFAFGAQKLLPSFQSIYASLISIKHSAKKADGLLEIIDNLDKNQNIKQLSRNISINKKTKLFNKSLEIKSISYRHSKNEDYIIDNFNLTIKRGEFIAIMGPSGKGKTTIIDIIMGLIIPEKGTIKVDGKYLLKDKVFNNIKDWRYSIGHVQQNVFLLDTTIKENIVYGKKISEIDNLNKKLVEVSKIVCLEELINSLPNGFDEYIGERGNRLSGGQIQRIGLARAIFNKNPIIILDEATSALDSFLEKKILFNIKNYCKDSALIMITHREKSTFICDKVVNI